jgi:hypothetical protein
VYERLLVWLDGDEASLSPKHIVNKYCMCLFAMLLIQMDMRQETPLRDFPLLLNSLRT